VLALKINFSLISPSSRAVSRSEPASVCSAPAWSARASAATAAASSLRFGAERSSTLRPALFSCQRPGMADSQSRLSPNLARCSCSAPYWRSVPRGASAASINGRHLIEGARALSGRTAVRMAKRYGHIGPSAKRSAMLALDPPVANPSDATTSAHNNDPTTSEPQTVH